jgi:hypothetical protein
MWTWVKELLGIDGTKDGKYYVYKLIDPRYQPPRVFYVGKGTGNRMYQHEKDMRKYLAAGRAGIMRMQPKHKRILEIIDDGYKVIYEIAFRTDNEEHAYQAESAVINDIGLEKLTNETYGYNTQAVRKRRAAARARR